MTVPGNSDAELPTAASSNRRAAEDAPAALAYIRRHHFDDEGELLEQLGLESA